MLELRIVVSSLVAHTRDNAGQTMPEYGVLLGIIALVVILAAVTVGSQISTVMSNIAAYL